MAGMKHQLLPFIDVLITEKLNNHSGCRYQSSHACSQGGGRCAYSQPAIAGILPHFWYGQVEMVAGAKYLLKLGWRRAAPRGNPLRFSAVSMNHSP
jgi:hypothetical protein